ncbi:GAF and ANTAR domain-containing protein [Blastococcus goldschmidtiae]|uniref:GAF and ANTAR domain-containing protein n=1 Tax=Blastococcus goldschmidtiae TaxID=3075546 RepID=A0ABU2KBQ5_9ACTN|nr:GAF and ANTAR domain-containing protein [Blastococcus sp. DSM 46792]MDT0277612.1 GAF and ANTAR domain-containing protein [Blastococcus sp. DSM 46792]
MASPPVPLTDELAGVFARMSGLLLSEETVATSLSVLSSLAHETVPGSCGAGVSLIEGRRRSSAGSTDERVREADSLQYELDQGPCLAAATQRELVAVEDLQQERRWPRWAAAVQPLGLRAALSAPLVAGDATLGAIKVYADHPAAFDARSRHLLALFSAQAALVVANLQTAERARRHSDGMRQAVRDRDVVGVAKGVLIGRHSVDEDAAMRMLIARSQDGVTLADAARAVVDSAVRRRRT